MSVITTLPEPRFSGLDASVAASPQAGFDDALPQAASDAVAFGPPGFGTSGPSAGLGLGSLYGGPSSGSAGLGGFGAIMNAFMTAISNALNSLGSALGLGGTTSGTSTPASGQQLFSTASASSVGDPHDAFSGTTAQGQTFSRAWNDMGSHGDLLTSDSFAGGYRVSDTSSSPASNGATYNARATVATNGGATTVAMNANGSYAIADAGRSVSLAPGATATLDGTETVTLNADGSLTVADTNASGGSLATTLRSNGDGGVDIDANASNVDLGGYLADHGSVHTGPIGAGPALPFEGTATSPLEGGATPSLGTFTTQFGSPSSSFGDVSRILQEDGGAI